VLAGGASAQSVGFENNPWGAWLLAGCWSEGSLEVRAGAIWEEMKAV